MPHLKVAAASAVHVVDENEDIVLVLTQEVADGVNLEHHRLLLQELSTKSLRKVSDNLGHAL